MSFNNYDNRRQSNGSRIDTPLQVNRARTSYGSGRDVRNSYNNKPKKPASMVEHKEPVLNTRVQLVKELLLALADYSTLESSDEDNTYIRLRGVAEALCKNGKSITHTI